MNPIVIVIIGALMLLLHGIFGTLGGLVGLGLIIWGIALMVKSHNKIETNNATFAGAAHSFANKGTGIGIYPDKRTLLLMQDKKQKEYSFADIRRWEINLQTGGNVVGQGVAVAAANFHAARENTKASGLFVEVRDIDHPVWRINMLKKSDQQRWMEILRQFINEQ